MERVATSHNQRINLTVRPVTRLACLDLNQDSNGSAQGARPSRPAGYARRYTTMNESRMKGGALAVVLALVASWLVPSFSVERDGLSFSVALAKNAYSTGDPVVVEFSWTNLTGHELSIQDWRGPTGGVTEIRHEGSEARYDFAVYTNSGESLKYNGEFACGPASFVRLSSGQTLRRSYDISNVYDLHRYGRYILRAAYSSSAEQGASNSWTGVLVHPDIVLEVQESK